MASFLSVILMTRESHHKKCVFLTFSGQKRRLYAKIPHFRAEFFRWHLFINATWSCWADLNRRPHPYQLIESPEIAGVQQFPGLFVFRKPLAGRVVQKRLLPMRKNKTPSVIVEMRSGNCKLQNKGRSLKNE